jgi:hypothetical protein
MLQTIELASQLGGANHWEVLANWKAETSNNCVFRAEQAQGIRV